MSHDDEMMIVILEDAEFSALVDPVSKEVIHRWRSVCWDVQATHAITGRFYAIEVDAPTSVEARNAFVSAMTRAGRENAWTGWKVRRV